MVPLSPLQTNERVVETKRNKRREQGRSLEEGWSCLWPQLSVPMVTMSFREKTNMKVTSAGQLLRKIITPRCSSVLFFPTFFLVPSQRPSSMVTFSRWRWLVGCPVLFNPSYIYLFIRVRDQEKLKGISRGYLTLRGIQGYMRDRPLLHLLFAARRAVRVYICAIPVVRMWWNKSPFRRERREGFISS